MWVRASGVPYMRFVRIDAPMEEFGGCDDAQRRSRYGDSLVIRRSYSDRSSKWDGDVASGGVQWANGRTQTARTAPDLYWELTKPAEAAFSDRWSWAASCYGKIESPS